MLKAVASEIMTRDVITVREDDTIETAMCLMARNNISGLPVVDENDRLVGIITETDVLLKDKIKVPYPRMALFGLFTVPDDLLENAYRDARGLLVGDVMKKKVVFFYEEDSVNDIAETMVEHKINRVPIVRGGKVVGIISRADIVRAMARQTRECAGCV
jgi:CBS domain-containing protein